MELALRSPDEQLNVGVDRFQPTRFTLSKRRPISLFFSLRRSPPLRPGGTPAGLPPAHDAPTPKILYIAWALGRYARPHALSTAHPPSCHRSHLKPECRRAAPPTDRRGQASPCLTPRCLAPYSGCAVSLELNRVDHQGLGLRARCSKPFQHRREHAHLAPTFPPVLERLL